jgi:hypothetical protein
LKVFVNVYIHFRIWTEIRIRQKLWIRLPNPETKCGINTDLIDNARLGVSEEGGGVPLAIALGPSLQLVLVLRQCDRLADDDVVAGDAEPGRDNAVLVQLVVDGVAHALTGLPAFTFL